MRLLPFLLGDGEKMAGKSVEDYTSDIFYDRARSPIKKEYLAGSAAR